jgi:ubiquinone/menaquinone biosynthesis C-methylase UbiE
MMAGMVCPPWVGFFLLNPLRRLFENPDRIFKQFITEGMIVLEPGCGMGFFTLPLAGMVGSRGRVVAADIQPKMLDILERRARKAGLIERIDLRVIKADNMGLDDLYEKVDFTAAMHMLHEVPDQASFFTDVYKVSKPGGKVLIVEPKGHVNRNRFEETISVSENAGFKSDIISANMGSRTALLIK